MAKMDKQVVQWIQKYDDLKKRAENIEKILLSFHVLIEKMLEHLPNYRTITKADLKKALSILKGPLLNPTRKKLRNLMKEYESLGNNLVQALIFFNGFRAANSKTADYAILYQNYKTKYNHWDKKEKSATVLKNTLIAELSVPDGKLYRGMRTGPLVREDFTRLKKEVDGFLAIIRPLKQ